MASNLIFSCKIPQQTTCFKIASSNRIRPGGYIPFKQSSQFLQKNAAKVEQNKVCLRQKAQRHKFVVSSAADSDENDITLDHLSAASMIKKFYACINEKKMKELAECISDDCFFEECSFISPIQGKKDVVQFYLLLTSCMGNNVKFNVENICENDEFTAGVNWQMEWKNRQIPLTRGCSFYECSQEGNRLVIKKARIVVESPIKPGGWVLVLLKNITGIFDDYPKLAEWFLQSPHVIVQFFIKIYSKLFAPIVNPILAGYIRLWNLIARLFALALSILLGTSKKYFE